MVSEAEAFNQELIRAGRATFRLASVEAIPFAADAFDHALAVNTIYFWPDPVRALAEIRRVLRPDGVLFVLAGTPEEMAKAPFTPYGFRVYDEAQLRKLHAEAGFQRVEIERYRDTSPTLDRTRITERENYFVVGVA
jgi:arsenite methyltransferase